VSEDSDGCLTGSAGMRIRACVVLEIEETSFVERRYASSGSRNRRGKMQSRDVTSRREDVN